jgi:Eukaryotic aspartyl protease
VLVDTANAWTTVVSEGCMAETVNSESRQHTPLLNAPNSNSLNTHHCSTPCQHENTPITSSFSANNEKETRKSSDKPYACPTSTPPYRSDQSSTFETPSCAQAHCAVPTDQGTTVASFYCDQNTSQCQVSTFSQSQQSGALVSDLLRVGEQDSARRARSAFVAVQAQRSLYGYTANNDDVNYGGILGLAQRALSDGVPTAFDSLVSAHNLSNVFSLCLNDEGGLLVLGGTHSTYYSTPLQYVPMLSGDSGSGLYQVSTPALSFLGSAVQNMEQAQWAVLSSTLPFISIPEGAYNSLVTLMQMKVCTGGLYNPILCGRTLNWEARERGVVEVGVVVVCVVRLL